MLGNATGRDRGRVAMLRIESRIAPSHRDVDGGSLLRGLDAGAVAL